MPTLAIEKDHLAQAERDLAEGQARIARQSVLVEHMQNAGQDVTQAEALLDNFRQTLSAWQDHRDEILRTIARLERGSGLRGVEDGEQASGVP